MAQTQFQLVGDVPTQSLQVVVDGIVLTFRLKWNQRAKGWWLELLDEQAEVIFAGARRLVTGFPMFADILPGFLFATGELRGEPADLTNMTLVYVDHDERVAAVEAAEAA